MKSTFYEARWRALPTGAQRSTGVALRVRGPLAASAERAAEALTALLGAAVATTRQPVQGEEAALQAARAQGTAGNEPSCTILEIAKDDVVVVLRAPTASVDVTRHVETIAARLRGDAPARPAPAPAPARDEAFWKTSLAAPLPTADFVLDRRRPASRAFETRAVTVALPNELQAAVREAATRTGRSEYLVLLAGVAAFVAMYTNGEEVLLGARVAPRHVRLDGSDADAAWLPIRLDVDAASGFDAVLAAVASRARAGVTVADAPIEEIQKLLGAEHPLALPYDPLSSLVVAEVDATHLASDGSISPCAAELGTNDPDLALLFLRGAKGWSLSVRYDAALWDEATIQRMLGHYAHFQRDVLVDPKRPIGAAAFMSPADAAALLAKWNDTHRDVRPATMASLFRAQVEKTPDAVAVRFGATVVTYAELAREAGRVADFVRARALPADAVVGIYVDPSPDLLIALLGVLEAGCAYLPLDPRYPENRLKYMVEDSACQLVLASSELVPNAPFDRSIVATTEAARAASPVPATRVATPESLAYVIYTSGSTGNPKGVEIEHRAWVNFAHHIVELLAPKPTDRFLSVTSLSFDISTLELFVPLATGGSVVLVDRDTAEDGEALRAEIVRQGVTVVQTTPTRWRLLMEAGMTRSDGLRLALCGGEAFPVDLARKMRGVAEETWNMYGPTEATVWCSMQKIDADFDNVVPIGRPFANTQLLIVNAYGRLNPVNVPGELCIGGDNLARGYHKRPELTAERFQMRPWIDGTQRRFYRTGDLARWRADGAVEYSSRLDRQIKLRGFRIEIGEIETVLRSHPAIRDCAVTVRRDATGVDMLVGYVIARFKFSAKCVIRADGASEEVTARDLSTRGMAVERKGASLALRPGAAVEVEVLEGVGGEPLQLRGTVAWARPAELAVVWADDAETHPVAHRLLMSAQKEGLARPEMTVAGSLSIDGRAPVAVRTVDVSANGVSLTGVPADVAIGTVVALRLDYEGPATLALRGKIVWRNADGHVGLGDLRVESGEAKWSELFDVRLFVSRRVPYYMVPTHTVYLEALPLSPAKKVDIKALPAPIATSTVKRAAAFGLAAHLTRIWAEELQIPDVPLDVPFRDVGGHSLALARIVARIRKELPDRPISLRQVAPTIDILGLAKILEPPDVEPEVEPAPIATVKPLRTIARLAFALSVCVALVAFGLGSALRGAGMEKMIKQIFGRSQQVADGTAKVVAGPPPVVFWGTSVTATGISPLLVQRSLHEAGKDVPCYAIALNGPTAPQLELLGEEMKAKLGGRKIRLSVMEIHPFHYADGATKSSAQSWDIGVFASSTSAQAEPVARRQGPDFYTKVMFSRLLLHGVAPAYVRMLLEAIIASGGDAHDDPPTFEAWQKHSEALEKTIGFNWTTTWPAEHHGGFPPMDDSDRWKAAVAAEKEVWRWIREEPRGKLWMKVYTQWIAAMEYQAPDTFESGAARDYLKFVALVKSMSEDVVFVVPHYKSAYRKTGAQRAVLDAYFRRIGAEANAPVWNYYDDDSFVDEDVLDVDHVTTAGREKFSKKLAARVGERLK